MIDVIMLSNAKTIKHYWMTHNAVQGILKSSKDIEFNIMVMETAQRMPQPQPPAPWREDKCYSTRVLEDHTIHVDQQYYKVPEGIPVGTPLWLDEQRNQILISYGANRECIFKKHINDLPAAFDPQGPVQFHGATVIQVPLPFNYNQAINIGVARSSNEWVFVMNNDVVVYPGAFDKMITAGYDSVSPMSAINAPGQNGATGIEEGYQICRHIAGWCIGCKRWVFARLPGGKMDERYFYFHQDVQYSTLLHQLGIKHALVTEAKIDHLQCQSHPETKQEKEWSLESTRRFYHQFPQDYVEHITGIHTGEWSREQIFDEAWTKEYELSHPEYRRKPVVKRKSLTKGKRVV